jgi:hypothetical protein
MFSRRSGTPVSRFTISRFSQTIPIISAVRGSGMS